MADLTFNVEKLTQMETAALVKINGAIDAKTVVLFQEQLDQLQQDGYTRFILDMEGIKYVNSTGLGTLVNVADALESRGGGIALIKIHSKVRVVFDMLGLNAFFKIFSDEVEALSHLQKPKPSDTKIQRRRLHHSLRQLPRPRLQRLPSSSATDYANAVSTANSSCSAGEQLAECSGNATYRAWLTIFTGMRHL